MKLKQVTCSGNIGADNHLYPANTLPHYILCVHSLTRPLTLKSTKKKYLKTSKCSTKHCIVHCELKRRAVLHFLYIKFSKHLLWWTSQFAYNVQWSVFSCPKTCNTICKWNAVIIINYLQITTHSNDHCIDRWYFWGIFYMATTYNQQFNILALSRIQR